MIPQFIMNAWSVILQILFIDNKDGFFSGKKNPQKLNVKIVSSEYSTYQFELQLKKTPHIMIKSLYVKYRA